MLPIQSGRPWSLDGFAPDKVLVIYFGYTTCLKACPTALNHIAVALDDLGAEAGTVTPVFVDMDPEKAAELSLPLYLQGFGPTFLGLTGTPQAVAAAAVSFGVEVEKLQFSTDADDYAMLHLSPIFVMRPGDDHPVSLPATSTPDEIENAIRATMAHSG